MKIALIGPGIMPIPPVGHGAVEILIWDYYLELEKHADIEVDIINRIRSNDRDQNSPTTEYCTTLISEINKGNYDFVHIHYDCLYHIMPFLTCKSIGITSHYPYIDQAEKHGPDGYSRIFQAICNNENHYIFALSRKDRKMFETYCKDKSRVFLMMNGANQDDIKPTQKKRMANRSIYLGKVEARKQQTKFCHLGNVDFYGKCDDDLFKKKECYKGEPRREDLVQILSHYGNMVLLSSGENGTPLVIKEALMAGLPIVTNRFSADDFEGPLPFVDIIPDEKMNDLSYIQHIIRINLQKQYLQDEIREYAVTRFSWKHLVREYIDTIRRLL